MKLASKGASQHQANASVQRPTYVPKSISTRECLQLIGCSISRFRDLQRNDPSFPNKSLISRPNHPRWNRQEMESYADRITRGAPR